MVDASSPAARGERSVDVSPKRNQGSGQRKAEREYQKNGEETPYAATLAVLACFVLFCHSA